MEEFMGRLFSFAHKYASKSHIRYGNRGSKGRIKALFPQPRGIRKKVDHAVKSWQRNLPG